jgi:hypothetical protein
MMKTLLVGFMILGAAASACMAQELTPAIADVAKTSRARTLKAAKVVTNDDIPSRPAETLPQPATGNNAKLEAKTTSTPATKADENAPCPADLLRDLLDQQGSVLYGIEVLRATIAVESDANRLRRAQERLETETGRLAILQQQIDTARKGLADPPADCGKSSTKDSADVSAKSPAAPPAPPGVTAKAK